jgi:hypothetical protein
MELEAVVSDLGDWAAEGALGWHEANAKVEDILGGIAQLRARIDELGGYHDDI